MAYSVKCWLFQGIQTYICLELRRRISLRVILKKQKNTPSACSLFYLWPDSTRRHGISTHWVNQAVSGIRETHANGFVYLFCWTKQVRFLLSQQRIGRWKCCLMTPLFVGALYRDCFMQRISMPSYCPSQWWRRKWLLIFFFKKRTLFFRLWLCSRLTMANPNLEDPYHRDSHERANLP